MVQAPTEPLPKVAEAALKADHWERDRVAWNLPRDPVEMPYENYRDAPDWESFRDLHYPDSRRHNFEAIVAYGAFMSPPDAGSPTREATAHFNGDASSTEALSLDEWEGEKGGATP